MRGAFKFRKFNIFLQALVYQENGWWIAHCLEMDIVVEGNTANEALRNLDDLCGLQIEAAMDEGNLTSIYRSASPEIWHSFSMGKITKMPYKPKSTKPVKRFEARELVPA